MTAAGRVHCDKCDRWITVKEPDDIVECECGTKFAVTITSVPTPSTL